MLSICIYYHYYDSPPPFFPLYILYMTEINNGAYELEVLAFKYLWEFGCVEHTDDGKYHAKVHYNEVEIMLPEKNIYPLPDEWVDHLITPYVEINCNKVGKSQLQTNCVEPHNAMPRGGPEEGKN